MNTLIKSTLIASAIFTSSLAVADTELLSHPVEGIMGFGEVSAQSSMTSTGGDTTLAFHPTEGIYMVAPATKPVATMAGKSHCVDDAGFQLGLHSTERLLGTGSMSC